MKALVAILAITLAVVLSCNAQNSITHYQYWFDNATPTPPVTVTGGNTYNFNQAVNTSGLSQGLHTCNIRFKDATGLWSSVVSEYFYKSPLNNLPNKINAYRYWFDTNTTPTLVTLTPQSTANVTANINCTSLSQGTHNFHIQFRDVNGLWSAVTDDVFTVGSISPPVVQVTSPNGGENWEYLSTHQITATFPAVPGTWVAQISTGQGQVWHQINGGNTDSGSLSFPWLVNYGPSTYCRLKVICTYQDGTVINDISDGAFTISAPASGMPFYLNPDDVSHLYWPFENSNWAPNPFTQNNVIRNNWFISCGNNCNLHHYSDYYAQDWVRDPVWWSPQCDAIVKSPLDGTAIAADYNCSDDNCFNPLFNSCNNDANNVYIQSSVDASFVFGVLHIKSDNYISLSSHVTAGQFIGKVGATNTAGAHAHFVLYRNILTPLLWGQQPKWYLEPGASPQGNDALTFPIGDINAPNLFAAEFIFDANPNLPPFQQSNIPQPLIVNHSPTICPGDSITLTAPTVSARYFWSNGDTTQSITVYTSGTYSVYMVDSAGNGTMSQGFTVTLNTYEVDIAASNQFICGNTPVVLYPSLLSYSPGLGVSGDKFNHYLWSTGDTTSNTSIISSGTYSLTFTDGYGCRTSVDSITITTATPPNQPTITANGNQLTCSSMPNCTYQWVVNNYPIPNATAQTYTADSTGGDFYYSVVVTNASGCSAISDSVVISGINELIGVTDLSIYPNPSTGIFTLSLKSTEIKSVEISCLNILGQPVLYKTLSLSNGQIKTELNLSSVAKGLYLVEVRASGKPIYKKIDITN